MHKTLVASDAPAMEAFARSGLPKIATSKLARRARLSGTNVSGKALAAGCPGEIRG